MNLESDAGVLEACMQGMERRWQVIDDPENALFNFIYHALTLRQTPELESGVNALRYFPNKKTVSVVALKRKLPDSKLEIARDLLNSDRISIQNRPIDEYAWRVNPRRRDAWALGEKGTMEFTGIDFLIAENLGRYHGFVK